MSKDLVADKDLFDDYANDSFMNRYEDEVDISISKFVDKSLQIKNMIIQFELRLLGYMVKGNGEKMIYVGKPILGFHTIQKIMVLLEPFSQDSMMISDKNDLLWDIQLARTRYDLVVLLTKNNDFDAVDTLEVWRSFSNLLFNIGDIIKGKNSYDLVEKYFGLSKDKDDVKEGII